MRAHTWDKMSYPLAERSGWQCARRDDSAVTKRLYRKHVVNGVYQLDKGTLSDDLFHFLAQVGAIRKAMLAVWVHVALTLLMFAPGMACRRQGGEASAGKTLGWQRWPRQLPKRVRQQTILIVLGCYRLFPLAGYSPLVHVKLRHQPPSAPAGTFSGGTGSHCVPERRAGTPGRGAVSSCAP